MITGVDLLEMSHLCHQAGFVCVSSLAASATLRPHPPAAATLQSYFNLEWRPRLGAHSRAAGRGCIPPRFPHNIGIAGLATGADMNILADWSAAPAAPGRAINTVGSGEPQPVLEILTNTKTAS